MGARRLSADSADIASFEGSAFESLQSKRDKLSSHTSTSRSSLTTVVGIGEGAGDTAPFLNKTDEALNYENYDRPRVSLPVQQFTCDWLPVTLRLPFLVLLIMLSLALGLSVLALTVYSMQNHGLGSGKDSDSSIIFFGWRFSPTLAVTIYGILVASLLNDVRRTEVFARMSRLGGASASTTICFPVRSWWNDPFDALNKKTNNGVYSWALLFTSLAYILVLLVLAPLSAGLLAPVTVQYRMPTSFSRAYLADNFAWQTDSWDLTSFRAISGAILNQSTSAWLSDHTVVPFWPNSLPNAPLGSSFRELDAQQWTANTDVYKAELTCVPMTLKQVYSSIPASKVLDNDYVLKINETLFELDSGDGCLITTTAEEGGIDDPWLEYGGGWLVNNYSNATSDCDSRALIFAKTPGSDFGPSQVQAHLCSRAFYFANIMVNVTINQSSTLVTFDHGEFGRSRVPWQLEGNAHNLSSLEQAFLSSEWTAKFPHYDNVPQDLNAQVGHRDPSFYGPLLPIAVDHANNSTMLVEDVDLAQEISKLYQRFFGEMLLLALQSTWSQSDVLGQVTTLDRRISVGAGIGITISVLFLLLDPAGIAAAASLMTDKKTRSDFLGTDHVSKGALEAKIGGHTFSMDQGKLLFVDSDAAGTTPYDRRRDPRPILLRGWMGPVLLVVLSILIAALIVLFRMSQAQTGIHQSVFVYQLNLEVLGATTTMAPYSIVPTLCAVGVKLWFESIGDIFKRLQPYITMSKAPSKLIHSVLAEYANTPTPFVSVKAVQNAHWLLVIIGLGAFATEVFTVGMSALWALEVRSLNHTFILPRRLTLRDTPMIFPWARDGRAAGPYFSQPQNIILPTVYTIAVQSWLYSAVVEISQSASTPPWTKDAWSFLPLDLVDLSDVVSPISELNTWIPGKTRNITFQTTAVRARLQCEPLDYPNNKTAWLERLDFNSAGWNVTNRPHGLSHGYTLIGPANALGESNFTCCANETSGVAGDAAIGYWMNYDWSSKSYRNHLSATWIVGRPLNGTFKPAHQDYSLWIWPEEPKLFATNCTPILEQAEAQVTAEVETGTILTYDIITREQNASVAWSDNFLEHLASVDYAGPASEYTLQEENITVSWGDFFWDTLINSGRSYSILNGDFGSESIDPTQYRTFNFLIRGLNVDFMSFAMLELANNTKEALLEPQTYMELASTAFGVFFKHYASENITRLSGGHIYEPVGDHLPWSLGPVINETNRTLVSTFQGALSEGDSVDTSRPTILATYSIPVEQLVMSPVAVYLCLSILSLLVVTTIIMYSANRSHFKGLPRDVDTLASTLAFVHGSDKLLDWAQDGGASTKPWYKLRSRKDKLARQESKRLMAQMGPFKDQDGNDAWGIELVESRPK
ncbi:hypothetical protein KCU61_g5130, partial [Aureobasidium melanogenum]